MTPLDGLYQLHWKEKYAFCGAENLRQNWLEKSSQRQTSALNDSPLYKSDYMKWGKILKLKKLFYGGNKASFQRKPYLNH
jgi:hypothetical protein